MNWQDKGFLLSINKYNENSSIAEFYTKNKGKAVGIIFGSTSNKIKNYLIIGNKLHINYTTKNSSTIGNFKLEIDCVNTPAYLDDRIKLLIIIYSMKIIKTLTVENQCNENIYFLIDKLFTILRSDSWLKDFILWELELFKSLGYEIIFSDYTEVHNQNGLKKYVLKNDKSKVIPDFLINQSSENIEKKDMIAAMKLISDFMNKSIFLENNISIPEVRGDIINLIE